MWITHNMCKCEEHLQIDEFSGLLGIVDSFAFASTTESIRFATFCLEQLSNTKSDERLKMISQLGCVAHILHKLGSDHTIPITSVVKFYGNLMSASDDELLNTLLDLKILDKMPYMIEKLKEDRLQEISWMLSNITAGTP